MQENLRNTNICYPKQETWFICWDDKRGKIKAYGSINTNQCMDTYWNEVDYYLDEAEWLEILIENGIKPNED
jgi:hypothetical protein